MKFCISRSTVRCALFLILAGAAAGFLNGLLGAGGGILLVYAFSALNRNPDSSTVRDNFAATAACVLPMSALSLSFHASFSSLPQAFTPVLLLPAAAGGICGAFLLEHIRTDRLKQIFALLLLIAGTRMLLF